MNSEFEVEIAGTSQGISYDLVTVTANVLLGGNLDIVLLNNFTPALNDEFEVLTAGSITGQFASTTLPGLPEGLAWDVRYATDSVTLAVIEPISGDFNKDGHVDAADYVIWRKLYAGDMTKYNDWRTNFGNPSGNGASENANVPEPTTVLLVAILSAICGLHSRSKPA
jgi:hypothetical protein